MQGGFQIAGIGPRDLQYGDSLGGKLFAIGTVELTIPTKLPEQYGIKEGDLVKVESRRGELVVPAKVVVTIRPDTEFIPYHWAGRKSANLLTNRAYDPVSKIPEFKKSVVRLSKVESPLT